MGDYTPPPAQLNDDSAVHLEVVDRDGQPEQAPVVDLPDVIADVDLDLDDTTGSGEVVDVDDALDID